ncbi:hypothetical protein WT21_12070 [Burkholderia territorii]|nr:hypothetical protein WS97_30110 [Burkholderia territorii]KVQ50258.1 hypothetical protein WT21_12070 [Burkholderia territorii]KVT77122.1 hypothetical protein WT25_23555 [Burkholderia territorii]
MPPRPHLSGTCEYIDGGNVATDGGSAATSALFFTPNDFGTNDTCIVSSRHAHAEMGSADSILSVSMNGQSMRFDI